MRVFANICVGPASYASYCAAAISHHSLLWLLLPHVWFDSRRSVALMNVWIWQHTQNISNWTRTKWDHGPLDGPIGDGVAAPPGTPAGGGISIKYLPWVIVGVLLAVPILTISVLKGCWMLVDYFCPPVQAYTPMNYSQMRLREDGGEEESGEK